MLSRIICFLIIATYSTVTLHSFFSMPSMTQSYRREPGQQVLRLDGMCVCKVDAKSTVASETASEKESLRRSVQTSKFHHRKGFMSQSWQHNATITGKHLERKGRISS